MADVKISGLPASTTPLAGTEVLPIVQSGTTKQVSIANVTAGRSVAALSVITPTIQAEAGSAGGTIKNGSGVAQMQWGSGGASNLSLEVATNINPANAAVSIAPTGTGTVTINPATASNMNNVAIGGTTPLAGKFTTLEATGVTTVQAGTNSAPAITTTGDTNTGIFFPAADTIAFTEGGAEAMRINSDSQIVTTAGTVSLPAITTTGNTNTGIFFPAADTIAFTEGGAEAARITSAGALLVGTTSTASAVSNTKRVVGGNFSSFNGTLTNLATATPYTLFTAPADFTAYLVTVCGYATAAQYSETAIVHVNLSSIATIVIADGASITISNSGTDIRVTQNSGGDLADLAWSAIRIL